jgi:hypothetical protein
MVLRPCDDGRYTVVGPAFFHGFMNGEGRLAELQRSQKGKEIVLV